MNRSTPQWPDTVSVSRELSAGEGPRLMIARAVAELVDRYGNLSSYELDLDGTTFDPPRGAFLVARAAGATDAVGGVGVRGVRRDSGGSATGEVRRLWVDPAWRGRGVARALMGALEVEAVTLGLRSLELATGYRQPEAVALYAATGWKREEVDHDGRPLPAGYIRFTKLIA